MNEKMQSRREAFRKNKAMAGNAVNLITNIEDRPWKVYFDMGTGEILCVTKDHDVKVQENWTTYPFTDRQLAPLNLDGKRNLQANYYVSPDEKISGAYKLAPVRGNTKTVTAATFLEEIPDMPSYAFSKQLIQVAIHTNSNTDRTMAVSYNEIPGVEVLEGQNQRLRFFLTSPGNPHIIYHMASCSLVELLQNMVTHMIPPSVPASFSVFTLKNLNSYGRYDTTENR